MGYCLYRPQPFEAGPGAESVRSVADSCWSRIKGRDKVELKLGCGNYDPQTPPSTLDSISLKDYPDRLLGCVRPKGVLLADGLPGGKGQGTYQSFGGRCRSSGQKSCRRPVRRGTQITL